MKKSLNKVIVTLAAVTALTAAMAVTASAAVSTTQTTTDGKTTITANVTGKTAGEQVTMLVLKPGADTTTDGVQENEIAYIDQKAADDQGNVTFTMPIGTTTAGETYDLLSGSTSATEASTGEVVIPGASEKTHYGDVYEDNKINSADALEVQYYSVKMDGRIAKFYAEDGTTLLPTPVVNDDLLKRADVTKEGTVNSADALEIAYYAVGMENKIDDSWGPENKPATK